MDKADYVKRQGQIRKHHCHWPGCNEKVPPAMWGCKRHWFTLPKDLRDKIWSTYTPGQEILGTPSKAYLIAAEEVQKWIAIRRSKRSKIGVPVSYVDLPNDLED